MEKLIVVFDLDGTLSESKSPISKYMASLLNELLTYKKVCIITGGTTTQVKKQVLGKIIPYIDDGEKSVNLQLMPTCGTKFFAYDQSHRDWEPIYEHNIPKNDRKKIIDVIEKSAKQIGLWDSHPYGDIIEDRGSQITFSALGQAAPYDLKVLWDPTDEKKTKLRDHIAEQLPEFEVRSGGSTSIDITKKGVDKAYGIEQLRHFNGVTYNDILFIGDRLQPGGNDYPVKLLGVDCIEVKNCADTEIIIQRLIESSRDYRYN